MQRDFELLSPYTHHLKKGPSKVLLRWHPQTLQLPQEVKIAVGNIKYKGENKRGSWNEILTHKACIGF